MAQVDWVQPQSSMWSDGSCHEIRFNLHGSPSVGDIDSVITTTGGQCSGLSGQQTQLVHAYRGRCQH